MKYVPILTTCSKLFVTRQLVITKQCANAKQCEDAKQWPFSF